MHSTINNIEIMISDEANKVKKELSGSLKNKYQKNLESIKGSKFVLIIFSYCIINVIKQVPIIADHI